MGHNKIAFNKYGEPADAKKIIEFAKKKRFNKRYKGKKNRSSGQIFERKVRHFLEDKGWIVDRWSNNVDLENDKLIPASSRFGLRTTGFPDFISFRAIETNNGEHLYQINGVECKKKGYISKKEKEKCRWLIQHKVFPSIVIYCVDKKKRGAIKIKDFVSDVKKPNGKNRYSKKQ
jgi:hypothetical protein